MERLLIIEDDKYLSRGICDVVEKKGYETICVSTLKEAEQIALQSVNLILLDCNLPDGDGVVFCKKLREKSNVPVIFLTARDTECEMVAGFQAGGDDYVAKPFSIAVLLQRIEAVLRRSGKWQQDCFTYKELQVDFATCSVKRNEEPVKLSATEYKLLEVLIKNRGQVLTRQALLEKIWDRDAKFVDDNTLNVYIRRLRQKIEPDSTDPVYVMTVFGIGYTFGET